MHLKEEHLYIMEKTIGYIKCKMHRDQMQWCSDSNKISSKILIIIMNNILNYVSNMYQ
jgi:hypothetical protein